MNLLTFPSVPHGAQTLSCTGRLDCFNALQSAFIDLMDGFCFSLLIPLQDSQRHRQHHLKSPISTGLSSDNKHFKIYKASLLSIPIQILRASYFSYKITEMRKHLHSIMVKMRCFPWMRRWRGLSQDSTRRLIKHRDAVSDRQEEGMYNGSDRKKRTGKYIPPKNDICRMPEGNPDTHLLFLLSYFSSSVQTCSGVDGTLHLTAAMVSVRAHPSLPIHSSADAPVMHGWTHTHTHTGMIPGVPIILPYATLSSLEVWMMGVTGIYHIYSFFKSLTLCLELITSGTNTHRGMLSSGWMNEKFPKSHTVMYFWMFVLLTSPMWMDLSTMTHLICFIAHTIGKCTL